LRHALRFAQIAGSGLAVGAGESQNPPHHLNRNVGVDVGACDFLRGAVVGVVEDALHQNAGSLDHGLPAASARYALNIGAVRPVHPANVVCAAWLSIGAVDVAASSAHMGGMKPRGLKGKRSGAESGTPRAAYGVNVKDTGRFMRKAPVSRSYTAVITTDAPNIKNDTVARRVKKLEQRIRDKKSGAVDEIQIEDDLESALQATWLELEKPPEPKTVVESKTPGYTETMREETAILHAASDLLSRIYPRERVEKALGDLAAAERETTSRSATATPRPDASDGLSWPTEKWKGSDEELSRKRYQIVAFLRRVWKPFIDDNNVLVTREILKEKDYEAGRALEGVLRTKGISDFPNDLRILTSEQLRDFLTAQPVSVSNMRICDMR
jgi:hypothetical protein